MPKTEKSGSSYISLLFRDVRVSTKKKKELKKVGRRILSKKAHSQS